MVWIIVAAVVVVLAALAWWSSGRARRGLDPDGVRKLRSKSQSDVGMQSGSPSEGPGVGRGGPFSSPF